MVGDKGRKRAVWHGTQNNAQALVCKPLSGVVTAPRVRAAVTRMGQCLRPGDPGEALEAPLLRLLMWPRVQARVAAGPAFRAVCRTHGRSETADVRAPSTQSGAFETG